MWNHGIRKHRLVTVGAWTTKFWRIGQLVLSVMDGLVYGVLFGFQDLPLAKIGFPAHGKHDNGQRQGNQGESIHDGEIELADNESG